jgi:hypothetical protein
VAAKIPDLDAGDSQGDFVDDLFESGQPTKKPRQNGEAIILYNENV